MTKDIEAPPRCARGRPTGRWTATHRRRLLTTATGRTQLCRDLTAAG
ncbi:hypothetical protein [Streptomyces sp. NPDC059788]